MAGIVEAACHCWLVQQCCSNLLIDDVDRWHSRSSEGVPLSLARTTLLDKPAVPPNEDEPWESIDAVLSDEAFWEWPGL